MHHGKRLHEWDQTGELTCILLNANRNPKHRRRPFTKPECVPRDLAKEFRVPSGIRLTKGSLHAMKPLFEKGT